MKIGIYIGRLNPMHLGHEAVIQTMLNECDKSYLLLGSVNEPQSMRHFFSYSDRRLMILRIFPRLRIINLPDYKEDADWYHALEDILLALDTHMHGVVFYGGCREDMQYLIDRDCMCNIIHRTEGGTPVVSATQVRTALLKGTSLDGLVNTKLITLMKQTFAKRWEEFQNK